MDALWWRYQRAKEGKWATLGSQQDVFELLERLIKALHRLTQNLPADPVAGPNMGQPVSLFVSRIQDLEQCKSCFRSRNLGAADYYMYVGLPLPPRATFEPKFQDMINWAWNQDIVSNSICECGDVEKNAIRKRRLSLPPKCSFIFHQGPSLTTGHYAVRARDIDTRRGAFLDDDKPPATYNIIWKLASRKQQRDPNTFQIYAVIAENNF
ncbi:hypothetical protein BDV10DRAFT_187879 [Aspergillus recurvatus]